MTNKRNATIQQMIYLTSNEAINIFKYAKLPESAK